MICRDKGAVLKIGPFEGDQMLISAVMVKHQTGTNVLSYIWNY